MYSETCRVIRLPFFILFRVFNAPKRIGVTYRHRHAWFTSFGCCRPTFVDVYINIMFVLRHNLLSSRVVSTHCDESNKYLTVWIDCLNNTEYFDISQPLIEQQQTVAKYILHRYTRFTIMVTGSHTYGNILCHELVPQRSLIIIHSQIYPSSKCICDGTCN